MFIATGFPAPDAAFLLQLFACVGALLAVAWLVIRIWQAIFPPKTPKYHELATKEELAALRADVSNALNEMKDRALRRSEEQARQHTELAVAIAKVDAQIRAQNEFNLRAFENMSDKIANVSKSAHKRMDAMQKLNA